MNKSLLLITMVKVTGSVHSLFSMELLAAPTPMIRTFSFCPQTEAFRRTITQNDPRQVQSIIHQLPASLTLQYALYLVASAVAKPIILARIKDVQRTVLLRDLPKHYGISDFIKSFSELAYNIRKQGTLILDSQFLTMVAELRQELLFSPMVQQNNVLKELAEQMPCIAEPKKLLLLAARSFALSTHQNDENISIALMKVPEELRPLITFAYNDIVGQKGIASLGI
jgi:hypothetical protein